MLRKVIILILTMMMVLTTVPALAQVEKNQSTGTYQATISVNGRNVTFPVYCINQKKMWPDGNAAYDVTYDYLKDKPELLQRLHRILFAGYPTNGMNYYTLGETPVITETEFNEMLRVPSFILEYEEGGNKPFAYLKNVTLSMYHLNPAGDFLSIVETLADADVKSQIKQTPFYRAFFAGKNYENQLESLAAMLAPSERNAWWSTQFAIWKLMTDHGIEDNSFGDLAGDPLAEKLYHFAYQTTPDLLLSAPATPIVLSGSLLVSQDTDGKWKTGPLSIAAPENYRTTYQLQLPADVVLKGANPNALKENQVFHLEADTQEALLQTMIITADISWPSALYLFSTQDADYQHMAGAYPMRTQLSISFSGNIQEQLPPVPNTGDAFPVLEVSFLFLLTGCAMTIIGKKKFG